MTLIEAFVRDEIILNPYEEPIYGEDQCCICYPERFAIVSLALRATNGLIQIADRIRTDLGFRPMHPMDEYDGDSCDNEGWYLSEENNYPHLFYGIPNRYTPFQKRCG